MKAAIVMKKAGVPLRAGAPAPARRDDSIREALGEDLEPRLKKLLAASGDRVDGKS